MDKYFSKSPFETESPYVDGFGFARKGICREFSLKPGIKATFAKVQDPVDEMRLDYQRSRADITSGILNEMRKRYLTSKLRKLMATELIKNHIKGDLKRIVQKIDKQSTQGNTEFVVLGGGPKSLSYLTRQKPTSKATTATNGSKAFTIEVDVRGYIPDNVMVDTENNRMSIRAIRVNGTEKALRILAPSTKHLEKIKVHPPKAGILLLQYPAPSIIPKTTSSCPDF